VFYKYNNLSMAPLIVLLIAILTSTVAAHAADQGKSSVNNNLEPLMVRIAPGNFYMGSNSGDPDEKPVHQVSIRKAFEIGKTEVTQGQWKAVMGKNPSLFSHCGDNCPVENVSWNDVQAFIQKLNAKTGKQYLLPSEAEWEYACRAGHVHKKFCGQGEQPDRLAWYVGNSGQHSQPVGKLTPNNWGLYDMSGNVWEWIQDCDHVNYNGAPADGTAWETGHCEWRLLRGGSWEDGQDELRAANRFVGPIGGRDNIAGFRVARTLP
jgi:formylglycine-generating enzyme required for sulfatase activity